MTRDPLGIVTATLLAIITTLLTAAVLNAGGWWLLALAPVVPLAAVTAYGYWASVPRRHRDEKGNPIR